MGFAFSPTAAPANPFGRRRAFVNARHRRPARGSARPVIGVNRLISMRHGRIISLALAAVLCLTPGLGGASVDDRFDEAVRALRKATTVRGTGEHILLLSSLRQLGDAELQPLFSSLSQVRNPTVQINAVLGLAELSRNRRIDPWKLSQIKDARFRALAIIQARDEDLIGPAELHEILAWPDLSEDLRVYVLLLLVSLGEAVDSSALTTLMTQGELPGTRAYAALALCHLGRPEGTDEALKALDALPPLVRDGALREMLGTVAYMKLRGAASWIRGLLAAGELGPTAESIALRTLLRLEPAGAAPLWQEHYRNADNVGHQVRLALMLLEQARSVPAELFSAPAAESNELLSALGTIGRLVASGQPAVEECIALISRRYPPASAWVIEHARTLEAPQASILYAAIIDDSIEEGAVLNDRLELARLASVELLRLDRSALRRSLDLARARQRRLTVESILSGALTAAIPEALALIEGIDSWVSTRSQSLALLIKARYVESMSEDELYRLGLVYRGGGSVTPAGEVQAAWLYLRRTGQQGQALAAVLSDLGTEQSDR